MTQLKALAALVLTLAMLSSFAANAGKEFGGIQGHWTLPCTEAGGLVVKGLRGDWRPEDLYFCELDHEWIGLLTLYSAKVLGRSPLALRVLSSGTTIAHPDECLDYGAWESVQLLAPGRGEPRLICIFPDDSKISLGMLKRGRL